MGATAIGITFNEMMSGGVAMAETDPVRGHANPQAAVLQMFNTITIDDVDRFIAEPNHAGSIQGHINWAPFGANITAPTGVFNLFSPTGDPTLKLMVYELAIEHAGKPYYLAGHKNVKAHPIIDMWKDTTTLYTQLFEGRDKSGPVAAAGIVSLSPIELLKMTSTFRALHAPSLEAGAAAVAKFGRFFLGELWDTYVSKAAV